MQPTRELYEFFSAAYAHFNEALFDGKLAPCMLTVQRQKGCMGLFYPERWITENGVKCHELALNPTYFAAYRVVELFQTLVHEQCHMWQEEYGRPSRSGYHNREWAAKMESIGLAPSDTGEPGGRRTGQHMSDYPLPGGAFLEAARCFIDRGGRLKWMDRFRVAETPRPEAPLCETARETDDNGALLAPLTSLFPGAENEDLKTLNPQAGKNKIKYSCTGCRCNVWGKPGLRIRCDDCDEPLEPAT